MGFIKRHRRWCPQPKNPGNFLKLSTPVVASFLFVEIVLLLILPVAYYALLVPKTTIVSDQILPDSTYPLTNSQIKAAWPNLPTAQEIVNGDYSEGYGIIDSSMPGFNDVENHTWVSPINAVPRNYPSGVVGTRLVPVENYIYLKLNDTTWIQIMPTATNNPPYTLPSPLYYTYAKENGFLGTGLPAEYYVAIIVVISATTVIGFSYLLHAKRSIKAAGG